VVCQCFIKCSFPGFMFLSHRGSQLHIHGDVNI
jgi:hypothetical protein